MVGLWIAVFVTGANVLAQRHPRPNRSERLLSEALGEHAEPVKRAALGYLQFVLKEELPAMPHHGSSLAPGSIGQSSKYSRDWSFREDTAIGQVEPAPCNATWVLSPWPSAAGFYFCNSNGPTARRAVVDVGAMSRRAFRFCG
jgi:hypothetical protein